MRKDHLSATAVCRYGDYADTADLAVSLFDASIFALLPTYFVQIQRLPSNLPVLASSKVV